VNRTGRQLGISARKLLGQHDWSIFTAHRVHRAKGACLLRILRRRREIGGLRTYTVKSPQPRRHLRLCKPANAGARGIKSSICRTLVVRIFPDAARPVEYPHALSRLSLIRCTKKAKAVYAAFACRPRSSGVDFQ
jgi:hypothetical protein